MRQAQTVQDIPPHQRRIRKLRYRAAAVWLCLSYPLIMVVYALTALPMRLLIGGDWAIGFSPAELWTRG